MNFSPLRMDEQLNEMWMKLSKGKMLFGDFEALYHFSKDATCVVELGTAYGLGAMVLSLNGAEVFTVDNYQVLSVPGEDIPLEKGQSYRVGSIMRDYLKHFNSIRLIQKNSVEVAKDFKDESVDLLYIDADHQYDSVKEDFETWLPKVRTEGHVLFHDYTLLNRQVMEFINVEVAHHETSKVVEEIAFKSFAPNIMKIYKKKRNL